MKEGKIHDAADTAFLASYFPSATEERDHHWDIFSDGFKQGAQWHESLPLTERLTEEEKEKIKIIFWHAAREWVYIGEARGKCKVCNVITEIFGEEQFKEDTQ